MHSVLPELWSASDSSHCCWVHWMRNAFARLSKSQRAMFFATPRLAFLQPVSANPAACRRSVLWQMATVCRLHGTKLTTTCWPTWRFTHITGLTYTGRGHGRIQQRALQRLMSISTQASTCPRGSVPVPESTENAHQKARVPSVHRSHNAGAELPSGAMNPIVADLPLSAVKMGSKRFPVREPMYCKAFL